MKPALRPWRHVDGQPAAPDQYRRATSTAVVVVAGIAAIVSYSHIVHLALEYHQERVAAYLLPLSIDGSVATSSLILLRSARAQLSAPWLARVGLVLSVAATVAANVGSSLPLPTGWLYHLVGALVAGWSAIAFVLSAETAISMSRRRAVPAKAKRDSKADTPVSADRTAGAEADRTAEPDRTAPAGQDSTRTGQRARPQPSGNGTGHADGNRAAIRALLSGDSPPTHEDIAAKVGVHPRTVRRVAREMRGEAEGGGSAAERPHLTPVPRDTTAEAAAV